MSQLQFHYVTIDDRELFNSFFKEKKVKSFDASFVNCFILAQEGNIQIATDDDALYVIQEWRGYYPFMLQPYVMDEGADLVSNSFWKIPNPLLKKLDLTVFFIWTLIIQNTCISQMICLTSKAKSIIAREIILISLRIHMRLSIFLMMLQ